VFRDEGTPAQGGVYDVHSHRALDQLPLPPLVLEEATAYFWRSRYVNDDGSSGEWAAPQHFTTGVRDGDGDGDGILDAQAVAADADLNGDGIFDGTQIKLRGVNTLIGGGSVAVDASEDAQVLDIESVLALDPADPALGGGNSYDLPLGLVAFRLALAEGIRSVAVTLHLSHPPGDKMDLLTYDAARGWQSMADLAQPIDDDGRVVRLTLTDGGREDVDGVENGRIIFTGGYGRAVDYRGPDDDAVAAAVGDRGEAEVMGASPCFIGTAGP
jgi:hypothetical protein